MAIYHFSVKTISRSMGRSATAAIAYRSGERIECERLGMVHDYTRKIGVEFKKIYLPDDASEAYLDRSTLWNAVEQRETRKNSTVAREFEIAFPSELDCEQRLNLLDELCTDIVKRHQVAVDACIHAPHTETGSDERNYHAHILMSTRRLEIDTFTEKSRELDQKQTGEVLYWREHFADLCNQHLELANSLERVSHKSYQDQQSQLTPTLHEGVRITQLRRQGIKTEISRYNDTIKLNNEIILQFGSMQRLKHSLDQYIAQEERDLSPGISQEEIQQGINQSKARYQQMKQERLRQQQLEQHEQLNQPTPTVPSKTKQPEKDTLERNRPDEPDFGLGR